MATGTTYQANVEGGGEQFKNVSGDMGFIELNSGISLHYCDMVEMVDYVDESVSESRLTISLLLEGQVKFYLNGEPYYLGKNDPRAACGRIWYNPTPVKFSRVLKRGNKVRKVIISVGKDWLLKNGFMAEDTGHAPHDQSALDSSQMIGQEWTVSANVLKVAEDIISPPYEQNSLRQVMRESRALELVTLALKNFLPGVTPDQISNDTPQPETPPANCRLLKAHSFIEQNMFRSYSLEEIARHVGFSVSSLQRHFKATYGTTVIEYIRHYKLSYAKRLIEEQDVSVTEAAYQVGYSTPSSFATAFKREFGRSPKG